jgi:5'(3')-deoxyribonucleotidase
MKVFLDYDNTLCDLLSPWLDWLKLEKNIRIKQMDIQNWNWISENFGEDTNDYWKTKGIYDNIKPISGAVEFMMVLKKVYGSENVFLISNSASNMIREKEAHAKKHFGIEGNYFQHADNKWEYTSDGILIDDAPHNVVAHVMNNNKPAILFNYRNRYGWANVPVKIKNLTTCTDYGKILKVINDNKKYFTEE